MMYARIEYRSPQTNRIYNFAASANSTQDAIQKESEQTNRYIVCSYVSVLCVYEGKKYDILCDDSHHVWAPEMSLRKENGSTEFIRLSPSSRICTGGSLAGVAFEYFILAWFLFPAVRHGPLVSAGVRVIIMIFHIFFNINLRCFLLPCSPINFNKSIKLT